MDSTLYVCYLFQPQLNLLDRLTNLGFPVDGTTFIFALGVGHVIRFARDNLRGNSDDDWHQNDGLRWTLSLWLMRARLRCVNWNKAGYTAELHSFFYIRTRFLKLKLGVLKILAIWASIVLNMFLIRNVIDDKDNILFYVAFVYKWLVYCKNILLK